jgi:hypothetical protein
VFSTALGGFSIDSSAVSYRFCSVRFWVLLLFGVVGCQALPNESTTAQDSVFPIPATQTFSSLQVGQTSAATNLFVRSDDAPNNQNASASLNVTAVTTPGCPDFTVTAPGLPATVVSSCAAVCMSLSGCGQRTRGQCISYSYTDYMFQATFHPTVAAQVSCVVSISSDDGTVHTMTLTGTGTPQPVHASVTPTTPIGFGDVRRGTDSSPATITVANTGGQTLHISSVSVPAGFVAKSGPTAAYDVAPGASQTHSIACHPTALGPLSGQFQLATNDLAQPTISLALSCNGIDSSLEIDPSPAELPTTRVGEPVSATLDLHNTGTAVMNLETVTLTAATGTGLTLTMAPPANTTLAAGTGVTHVTIGFDAAAKGGATATLTASHDGGQLLNTSISALALGTSMSLTPDGTLDFGPVCGGQPASQELTAIANDQGSFAIETITSDDPVFAISSDPLPLAVAGADAAQVMFEIIATPTAPGAVMANVTVSTDIPGADPHVVAVSVEGLAAGVVATPAMVEFGSAMTGVASTGQSIHLSNCGAGPITARNARISGPDASEFAIVDQPSDALVPLTGTASWLVVLQARTHGPKQAAFAVDYDGGTASIPLAGIANGDDPAGGGGAGGGGGTGERASYYACSAGSPTALLPALAALAALAVRRRRAA